MMQEVHSYNSWLSENARFSDCYTIFDINSEFKRLSDVVKDERIREVFIWDAELFLCCELLASERDNHGFLYPGFVYANGHCIPDIDNFEPERLDFYKERLAATSTFLLRNRYMNYLIEKLPPKERYPYVKHLCQEILVFLDGAALSFDFRDKFSRLTELALSYNLNDELIRIKTLVDVKLSALKINKNTILESEDVTWGFLALSQCLRGFRAQISKILSEPSSHLLIRNLEECRDNANVSFKEVFIRELIEWAKINGSDVKDVARQYGEHCESLAQTTDSALAALAYYEHAMKIYLDYGISEKTDALKVMIKETHKNLASSGEIQEHHIDFTVPEELIIQRKQFIEHMTSGISIESISDDIHRLTSLAFVPSKEAAQHYAESSTTNSPLPMLASLDCMGNGRSVFIGNDLNDWELYFLYQYYSIALNFQLQLFNSVYVKFCEQGLNAEVVLGLFKERIDFIYGNQITIIAQGIERFFSEDYISAIHILVPQFEAVFRGFFESYGLPTTSVTSSVAQKEQTFTEFLKNEFVKVLPEEYLFLIEYVMTCQLGLNLRNNIAHGLIAMRDISKETTLLVLYLFFILLGFSLDEDTDDNNTQKNETDQKEPSEGNTKL